MGVRAQLANLISRHGIKLLPPQIERNSTRGQQLLIFKRKVPARCFTKLLPPQIERNNKRTAIFNFKKIPSHLCFTFFKICIKLLPPQIKRKSTREQQLLTSYKKRKKITISMHCLRSAKSALPFHPSGHGGVPLTRSGWLCVIEELGACTCSGL